MQTFANITPFVLEPTTLSMVSMSLAGLLMGRRRYLDSLLTLFPFAASAGRGRVFQLDSSGAVAWVPNGSPSQAVRFYEGLAFALFNTLNISR